MAHEKWSMHAFGVIKQSDSFTDDLVSITALVAGYVEHCVQVVQHVHLLRSDRF